MWSTEDALRELRHRGARRLERVAFRANRRTIWSLTQNATVLNLHEAYRRAPDDVWDAFATIVRGRGWRTDRVREASGVVRDWPGLGEAMQADRDARAGNAADGGDPGGEGRELTHCCASEEQRDYLRALYGYLNETRFGGRLPPELPIRLSSRMRTSLGHMIPHSTADGTRRVLEIALNVDLMLAENGPERVDTLLHEMAHVAEFLIDGSYGHGPAWKAWARHAGCRAERIYERPVARRRHDGDITRVPPLPPGVAARVRREGPLEQRFDLGDDGVSGDAELLVEDLRGS